MTAVIARDHQARDHGEREIEVRPVTGVERLRELGRDPLPEDLRCGGDRREKLANENAAMSPRSRTPRRVAMRAVCRFTETGPALTELVRTLRGDAPYAAGA